MKGNESTSNVRRRPSDLGNWFLASDTRKAEGLIGGIESPALMCIGWGQDLIGDAVLD